MFGNKKNCNPKCPYYNGCNPLVIENNNSDILLVFEAPGYYENKNGVPIYDCRNNSKGKKSTGSVIAQSFANNKMSRTDFDIVEATRCYPGSKGKKTQTDVENAAWNFCNGYLEADICAKNNGYRKIVCFGYVAYISVVNIITKINNTTQRYLVDIIHIEHPSSIISNNPSNYQRIMDYLTNKNLR